MTVYEALTAAQNLVIEHGKTRTSLSVEDEEEEEATIALLAYENHCRPESIHVHKEVRRTKCLE